MKNLSQKEKKRRISVSVKAKKFAKSCASVYKTDTTVVSRREIIAIMSIAWQCGYEKGRYES